jgi:hypothetical protein
LTTAVCFTVITAVTLASYSKVDKHNHVEQQVHEEGSTVAR